MASKTTTTTTLPMAEAMTAATLSGHGPTQAAAIADLLIEEDAHS
jgi:hypothetical protein